MSGGEIPYLQNVPIFHVCLLKGPQLQLPTGRTAHLQNRKGIFRIPLPHQIMQSITDLLALDHFPTLQTPLEELIGLVNIVKKETIDCLENQLILHPNTPPKLPIFFSNAYNVLKIKAMEQNIACFQLDTLPYEILCVLVNSHGPVDNFPREVECGFLEEHSQQDLHKVFQELAAYLANHCLIHDELPPLPVIFQLAWHDFEGLFATERLLNRCDDVQRLGEVLQEYLEKDQLFGFIVPQDYVTAW